MVVDDDDDDDDDDDGDDDDKGRSEGFLRKKILSAGWKVSSCHDYLDEENYMVMIF